MDQRDRMRTHSCDLCGLEFTNHDDYEAHMLEKHGKGPEEASR